MTVTFKKWIHRKDYYKKLIDITSEPYPELTNKEVSKEIDRILKNVWLSRRLEAKLLDLKQEMSHEKTYKK